MELEGSNRVYNSPKPVIIPNRTNPVHATPHFMKIHFNIILLPSCLFSSGFPNKTLCTPLHVPPTISFLSIWSPTKYLLRNTDL